MNFPKGPEIKLPKRPERKPNGSKIANAKASRPTRMQAPGPLNDLYRDMRDRRLILPALALLVAIIAVPFALNAESEPAPPPQPPAVGDEVTAVEPAVLAEDLGGVRDYRKRLDEMKSSNPFASEFEQKLDQGGGAPEEPEPVPESDGAPPPTSTPSPAAPVPSDSSGSGGVVEPVAPPAEPELLILAPRVDLSFGELGEVSRKNSVAPGDQFPRRKPIVFLAAVTDDLKKVKFLVFDGISSISGDGHCEPGRTNCQLLTLRVDERHKLLDEATGKRYGLKVLKIDEKIVDRRKVSDVG